MILCSSDSDLLAHFHFPDPSVSVNISSTIFLSCFKSLFFLEFSYYFWTADSILTLEIEFLSSDPSVSNSFLSFHDGFIADLGFDLS